MHSATVFVALENPQTGALAFKLDEKGARWRTGRRNIDRVVNEVREERPDITTLHIVYTKKEDH